ncbi:hypothetical protein GGH93_000967 [Coemansia aciculifera]|nr:hypothetical protein GGH93_000967 [Coemansia aciculifera]
MPPRDFILLPSPPTECELERVQDYTRLTVTGTLTCAGGWVLGGWIQNAYVAVKHHYGRDKPPAPRPAPTATTPAEEPEEQLTSPSFPGIHEASTDPSYDAWATFMPFLYFAGVVFSLTNFALIVLGFVDRRYSKNISCVQVQPIESVFGGIYFSPIVDKGVQPVTVDRGTRTDNGMGPDAPQTVNDGPGLAPGPHVPKIGASAGIDAPFMAVPITAPSLPETVRQAADPDMPAPLHTPAPPSDSGYSPSRLSIVVAAPGRAARPIRRRSIAISNLMRNTNDIDPQSRRARRATDGSLPSRRREATTASLPLLAGTDPEPPSPTPTLISVVDEPMPTPMPVTSVTSNGDGLTVAAEAADPSPGLVTTVEDLGTVALKDECTEAFNLDRSVVAGFGCGQQASPSSLVPVNERAHGEQDIDPEFGAVMVDGELPLNNYSYLAGNASSQLTLAQRKGKGKEPEVYDARSYTYSASASMQSTPSLANRALWTEEMKRNNARNGLLRFQASVASLRGAPKPSLRRDIEPRVERASSLVEHKANGASTTGQGRRNNAKIGIRLFRAATASFRRAVNKSVEEPVEPGVDLESILSQIEAALDHQSTTPYVAIDSATTQRMYDVFVSTFSRLSASATSLRDAWEPIPEGSVEPRVEQGSTLSGHETAIEPQLLANSGSAVAQRRRDAFKSISLRLRTSTTLARDASEPMPEETVEPIVEQESTTPSDPLSTKHVASQPSSAAPQPSEHTAAGPSNLHSYPPLSVRVKPQKKSKASTSSTVSWRGAPQPPLEGTVEPGVGQEPTPPNTSSSSPLKRLEQKASRTLRPSSSGPTTLASTKHVASQSSSAAPQPSEHTAAGPSNLHSYPPLSVRVKPWKKSKALTSSTVSWRGAPQPPLEETVEPGVGQEPTPSDSTPTEQAVAGPSNRRGDNSKAPRPSINQSGSNADREPGNSRPKPKSGNGPKPKNSCQRR